MQIKRFRGPWSSGNSDFSINCTISMDSLFLVRFCSKRSLFLVICFWFTRFTQNNHTSIMNFWEKLTASKAFVDFWTSKIKDRALGKKGYVWWNVFKQLNSCGMCCISWDHVSKWQAWSLWGKVLVRGKVQHFLECGESACRCIQTTGCNSSWNIYHWHGMYMKIGEMLGSFLCIVWMPR